MIFNVTVDRDEDGVWIVECPSIPGCVSQGKTKEEALENIRSAIEEYLAAGQETFSDPEIQRVEIAL